MKSTRKARYTAGTTESIRALRGQLEKMGFDDPRRSTLFRTYADQLLKKYARTLAADDLDEAIRVHKESTINVSRQAHSVTQLRDIAQG